MCYTTMYSYIKVYQKYLVTSILEDEICCNKILEYLQNISAFIANVIIMN